MKRWYWVSFLMILVLLAGCGEDPIVPKQGSLAFQMDFSSLLNGAQLASNDIWIQKVTVILSRANYTDIAQDLSVYGNKTTGQIENLDAGTWHIKATAYDSSNNPLFVGEADAEVKAGQSTSVKILFEPVAADPGTGGISIEVGVNPLPGYKALDQHVTKIFYNEVDNKIYLWDAKTSILGVYEADTMNRIQTIAIPQTPQAINFSYDKKSMILGYASGQVYMLNFTTGHVTQIGDSAMKINSLIAYAPNYILMNGSAGWYSHLKSMDVTTGTIVSSATSTYSFSSLVYNPDNQFVYASSNDSTSLFSFKADLSTGKITISDNSFYHSNYDFGQPVRLIQNNARLVSSTGNMFTTSSVETEDLQYAGSLGYFYRDLVRDPATGCLYFLNYNYWYESGYRQQLVIMDETTFFVKNTVDLIGTPQYVLATPSSIVVVSEAEGSYYSKVFGKTDLGL